MKKVLSIIATLSLTATVFAQDISYAEYFIDTDPGFGDALPIQVSSPGEDITLHFTANLQALNPGLHQIFYRAKDDSGRWGVAVFNSFFMVEIPSPDEQYIQQLEYFVDTDPGYGDAVPIPVPAPGKELTFDFTAGLETLNPGIHQIHVRGMNGEARWGPGFQKSFFLVKMSTPGGAQIQQLEYFIDTDPGYGNATQVSLTSSGSDLEIDFDVSLDGLSSGDHVIYLRAKNDLNQWGQIFMESFAYHSTGENPQKIHSMFKIYPNPASDRIMIELADKTEFPIRIRLTELNGKPVFETECDHQPCEIGPGVQSGMYLISIESGQNRITQKIILK